MSTEKFEVQFSQGSMAYQTSRGSDKRVGPVESSGFEIFRTLKMPVAGAGFTTSSHADAANRQEKYTQRF
jgi:hypothetical protein